MTVTISKPAVNLRSTLTALDRPAARPGTTFWTSGDAIKTVFALAAGWAPLDVYVDGALKRPGAGEDYSTTFDGFTHSVVFAVAPAAVDVAIRAELVQ